MKAATMKIKTIHAYLKGVEGKMGTGSNAGKFCARAALLHSVLPKVLVC